MTAAYRAVKSGSMNIHSAAVRFGVPRMTLSDRVKGKVKMDAKWGNKTALTAEEENSLVSYIEYMAKRGFPLTIPLVSGFAWCIPKQRGKGDVFTKCGPTKRWWQGFQKRHPQLRLRSPDSLDRGRASMGNVYSLREYFALLKDTLDYNDLHSKTHLIFNCDEAAINLNKSAGQRVVVPKDQKQAHGISSATNEHVTVHCCVNTAGGTIPPMVIFKKTYHKKGPVNATYAVSDTGFMDQELYFQWFQKTFLKYALPERPLLLIHDGASSHMSWPLIQSAIANDVIILCLPPKTTHITQPLDEAVYRKMKIVYRKMKIEAAKIMSQAKLIKSDLWVAKRNVSAMFKLIYELSFTMRSITEGFRKCGIYPFDPNAIDKTLLLRSWDVVNEEDIDLSVSTDDANVKSESIPGCVGDTQPMTSTPKMLPSGSEDVAFDVNSVLSYRQPRFYV
jgi:hypothetical protein